MMKRARGRGGQSTVEYVIAAGVTLPMIFALTFTAELLWVWHSVAEFTRDGANYAATHCWMASGGNVVNYMRTHVPPMVDMDQFQTGEAEIQVTYFLRDPASGVLNEFTCDGECSQMCIPDTVTVRVRNYEFRKFMSYLGLPPVTIPDFQTSHPVESAGCDPEQGTCVP